MSEQEQKPTRRESIDTVVVISNCGSDNGAPLLKSQVTDRLIHQIKLSTRLETTKRGGMDVKSSISFPKGKFSVFDMESHLLLTFICQCFERFEMMGSQVRSKIRGSFPTLKLIFQLTVQKVKMCEKERPRVLGSILKENLSSIFRLLKLDVPSS